MDDDQHDALVGVIDAMTTIVEVLLALGVSASVFEEPFRHQRDAHRAAGRLNASAVLDTFVDFVTDQGRQRKRQEIQTVFRSEPKGNA